MKVGQWARRNNTYYTVIKEQNNQHLLEYTEHNMMDKTQRMWKSRFWIDITPDFTIKDNPTELVQRNDLIEFKMNNLSIKKIELIEKLDYTDDGRLIIRTTGSEFILRDNITEIWTRTSDNTYTRQWKKEDSNI